MSVVWVGPYAKLKNYLLFFTHQQKHIQTNNNSHAIVFQTFVTRCSGETGNKSQGKCLSFSVQYCMTNIGPTLCIEPDRTLTITKHTEYSYCAFMSDSFCNSSSKLSLSYWKGVTQLLDRNVLIVSDKIACTIDFY